MYEVFALLTGKAVMQFLSLQDADEFIADLENLYDVDVSALQIRKRLE